MSENTGWDEYGKLFLKELERLNDNYESLRKDFDSKIGDLNKSINLLQTTEKTVLEQKTWHERVNEVWSPSQMSEAKKEIYRQKNRWTATVAIIGFIQIVIAILISLKDKF